jgi:DNA repair protein RadD
MVTLRPYQEDMIRTTMEAIPSDQFILIMAATGSGKTIFFSELCKRLLENWPNIRIGILAHRGILVEQARDKLLGVWSGAQIGIACASVESKKDTESPITIGTIQTLIKQTNTTAPFDLIIIDEAHRLRPKNKKSQYQEFLKIMMRFNPAVRVLGVTATPFQLGHGYCYGTVCRPDNENWFTSLNYRIGISDLQRQGYLCEYRAKEAKNISSDLSKVKVSGDFAIGELGEVMSRKEHVGSAVSAVEKYAAGRRRVVVFCVTIDHATRVVEAFREAGHIAAAVHSDMPMKQRDMTLAEFEAGRIRVLCNVGVLTEGWDSPAVDCIVMCRPTKSAALYVQMVGRGLRPHPDKDDVLILDLANNCREHGDPDKPRIPIPGRAGKADAILKVCPKCFELIPVGAKECRECGYAYPVEVVQQNGSVEMANVAWCKTPAPTVVSVVEAAFNEYVSKAGNRMMRLGLTCQADHSINPIWCNEFLDFDGNNEWAMGKARRLWASLVGTDPPASVDEAVERHGEMLMSVPARIEVAMKNKWWNVSRWGVAPWNLGQAEDDVPF